ncbi:hypothetical protein PPL_00714 [Heterostelium album PN500]|uniref:Uncharacterized protein n=1 Tax=Heterostelium pallidum (strain ATCC 26659 / Pp 5 / PN500) TaxID=670386 RepID=D3AX83_HETP5|nr:hypothetical protein PPL_00714 [Heterostelium album PN500]EFA86152.1 hypothetical protein PPL_00714 [Heterostelium album PN500]|eukprot:XP_020438257.1 hypothetical protein PPL_00714 [Heterostelium album PN500]
MNISVIVVRGQQPEAGKFYRFFDTTLGRCIQSPAVRGQPIELAVCSSENLYQNWLYTFQGQLFNPQSRLCLSIDGQSTLAIAKGCTVAPVFEWEIIKFPNNTDLFHISNSFLQPQQCMSSLSDGVSLGLANCAALKPSTNSYGMNQLYTNYNSINLPPVTDTNSIPLTTGASLKVGTIMSAGFTMTVNDYSFVLKFDGMFVLYDPKGQIVWSSDISGNYKNDTGGYGTFDGDGNLCSYDSMHSIEFCTSLNFLGGYNLNLLPAGSYGRPWGIVIQNQLGKMIWGRFGTSTTRAGFYSLIPGSFLDSQSKTNNILHPGQFITNGHNYLTITDKAETQLWVDNPFTIGKNAITHGPYFFTIQADGNVCANGYYSYGLAGVWCVYGADVTFSRYVFVTPHDGDSSHWGFMSHNGTIPGFAVFSPPPPNSPNAVRQGQVFGNPYKSITNGIIKVTRAANLETKITYLSIDEPDTILIPSYQGFYNTAIWQTYFYYIRADSFNGTISYIYTTESYCADWFNRLQPPNSLNFLVAMPGMPEFMLINSRGYMIWSATRDGFKEVITI